MEKVRLLANKAKALAKTFEYLYTVVDRTEEIEKLEFTVAEHPTLENVQMRLSKQEEDVKTAEILDNKALERQTIYVSVDSKNLVQFSKQENFLAWIQSIAQMNKAVDGGLDSVPENKVVQMLKGSIRVQEDKSKVDLMNTQYQIIAYMNGKYLGGTDIVRITFGDVDKLPNPNRFAIAVSN